MRRRHQKVVSVGAGLLMLVAYVSAAERLQIVWPTPNTAWADGKGAAQWLQHAGGGDPESGEQ